MATKPHPTSARVPLPPGQNRSASRRERGFSPLLADFPDPVLITNRTGAVVFLNRAAVNLFGNTLRTGDPCPLCPEKSGLLLAGEEPARTGCPLKEGESQQRLPVLLKDKNQAPVKLTASISAIKGNGKGPPGCLAVLRNLEEDVLAHPEVQLQKATLSSILENFPTPFFMVDPNLVVTHMNRRMEPLTGYSRKEVVGRMTCGAMLNTVQCDTEDCVLRQVMEHKVHVSGWRRVVRDRQGNEIPVVVYASIITDASGKVIGGFEAVRDITPRVEAEKKFELLAEHSREGIVMVDEDQRVLFANPRMADIARRPQEELIGMPLGEAVSSQHQRLAAALLEQEHHRQTEFVSTLDPTPESEGERRVFETCMVASRIGKSTIVFIYLRDLTDRIMMGRKLNKANNFLSNIINSSVDGIVVVDDKGVPLIFNEGAERILGYQAEEVVDHPEVLLKFYPLEVAREMKRRMLSHEYGPPDRLNPTPVTFLNKAGEEVPVRFSAAIVREGGRIMASVGIFSDLRETLRMRRELEMSQAQLVQAEKIASLGTLSAGVAHEINNPLAGILIFAELLLKDLAPDAPGRENVEEIVKQTLRCQQIVTRLLEFSRQSLGERTVFDVNEIIQRCVDLVRHQAFFHNIEIIQDLDPLLPQIVGDPGQMQQVFTNLLLNAADAMDNRGRISIASRPLPQEEGILLTFSDTGAGIVPDLREKIFEPFFTTKPPSKGTGLGLSIVFGVIQRHGGTIEVDSAPGRGTTFIIRLPLDSPGEGHITEPFFYVH